MRSETLDLYNEELLLVLSVSAQMIHQRFNGGGRYPRPLTVNCSSVEDMRQVLSRVVTSERKELTILIVVEILEESKQFFLIPSENGFDLRRLLGIGNKDLEYMERFELNVLALIAEEVHHHLEVDIVRNVARHDVEVGTVQKNLAEKFEGLPLRHIVGGLDEGRERIEESVIVLIQVFRDHWFVPRESFLEARVRIR